MASRDYVQLFRNCLDASSYFEDRYHVLQRHTILYQRSPKAAQHDEILVELCRYLEHPGRSAPIASNHNCHLARIHDFLSGKPTEATEAIQRQESILLNNLIVTLSSTKTFLLDDMSTYEFSELIETGDEEENQTVLQLCVLEMKRLEDSQTRLVEKYESCSKKTKSDLSRTLISREYSKNKRLNKFEKDVNDQVQELVLLAIDSEWNTHSNRLSELKTSITTQEISMQRWESRIKISRTAIQRSTDNRGYDEADRDVVCHSPPSDDHSNIGKKMPASMVSSGRQESYRNESSPDLSKASVEEADYEQITHTSPSEVNQVSTQGDGICLSVQACQSDLEMAQIFNTNPNRSECSRRNSGSGGGTSHPTASFNDSQDKNTGNASTPYHEVSPLQNFNEHGNKTNRQYEYEHNRDHTPPTRFEVNDKEHWAKAFTGLDKYAQTLFRKASSPVQ